MGTNLTFLISFLLTLAVNTYDITHTSETACPPFYNGSIAGSACSQEYTICVNGIQQQATCQEGFVFYDSSCVAIEKSPECQLTDTASDEQSTQVEQQTTFDCSSKNDGAYSLGCSNEFIQCVSGHAYQMYCPDTLFYVAEYDRCLESCDATITEATEEPEVQTTSTESVAADDVYDEPIIPTPSSDEQFDCSNLNDGNYVQGCSSVYFVCSNGNTYISRCPSNLVYNANQQVCDFECDSTTTTTPEAISTTTEEVSDDEPVTDAYAIPTEVTTTIEPEVFVSSSTTTTEAPTTSTEEIVPSTTTVEVTSVADDAPVPVAVATSSAEPVTVTNTGYSVASDSPICQNGQITSFGNCASRFTKCQNNAIVNKQCPTNTLFESDILLCVFDLPQCQPTVTPIQQYFPQPDIVVSPFDDSVTLKPRRRHHNHRRGPPRFYEPEPLVDNPFFVPPPRVHRPPSSFRRHHPRRFFGQLVDSPFADPYNKRAFVFDSYSDSRRINNGKLAYGSYKKAQGDRQFLIEDSFEGGRPFGFHSTVNDVFPKSATKLEVEGSGFNPQDDREQMEPVRRKRYAPISSSQSSSTFVNSQSNSRQVQVNQNCQGVTTPQFFNFGECFDEFIYCSGTGVNRFAACPIGEQFDTTTNTCSSTCGNTTVVSTVTTSIGEDVPSGYAVVSSTTTTPIGDDQTATESSVTAGVEAITVATSETTTTSEVPVAVAETTTSIPVGNVCSGISDRLVAIGCSQEYIHCSDGVAIRRVCPAALYFDETQLLCNYRDDVSACNGESDDVPSVFETTTTTSTAQPEGTYAPSVSPYSPIETTTTSNGYGQVVSPCEGLSNGPHGKGCSASYIVCSDGQLNETLTCSLGQGFDPLTGECVNLEEVSGVVCSQTATESTIISIADDEPVAETTTTATIVLQPVAHNNNSQACQSGARASVAFCSQNYLECVEDAYIVQSCEREQRFDSDLKKCVAKETCGHEVITNIVHHVIKNNGQASSSSSSQQGGYRAADQRCASADNNSLIATGQCRSTYIRCVDSSSSVENCQQNQVFCTVQLRCVDKWSVPHCARRAASVAAAQSSSSYGGVAQPQAYNYGGPVADDASDAFCQGKSDGLYKNPSDCSAILQCFGGDLFEYPACPSGLAFNEINGKCDYPQNVAGCDLKQDDQEQGVGCVHGAFIAHPDNCSIFYRCVWGRRVEMTCPSGTVFNPSLSVCDWPSAVSSCTST